MDTVFSDCGSYRYVLSRQWLLGSGSILWILLNPSTATESTDDPTIRRCVGFSRLWGYQRMELVNLFALRSTDPKALLTTDDPVGPDNDYWIQQCIDQPIAVPIMVAWGSIHKNLRSRAGYVAENLLADMNLYCLGTASCGSPRHPLYIAKSTRPVLWRGRNF